MYPLGWYVSISNVSFNWVLALKATPNGTLAVIVDDANIGASQQEDPTVGASVVGGIGPTVGAAVGIIEGTLVVGDADGSVEGAKDVGEEVASVGATVRVGASVVGEADGTVGAAVGARVDGALDGKAEGVEVVGEELGAVGAAVVGKCVGDTVVGETVHDKRS